MIKLNKMTDYAVVCLGMLSRKSGYPMSASELSRETGLTLYTVQKILKIIVSKSDLISACLLYTSPSPRDGLLSRMPSSA